MQNIDHTKKIIELKNVSYSYGDVPAVKDVDLEVHKGDYLGIIGPNGGGKTTVIRLILGLLTPSNGKIQIYNQDIKSFHDWSKIGYVSQNVKNLDSNLPMTVQEVVAMGRYPKIGLFHFPKENDLIKIRQALENVDMWDYRNRLIGDLSGGQQQRVFIARALSGEPEIVILDEPTIGVDIETQKQFYSLMQKLNKEINLTLILVSHELDVVAHEATEIAYINCNIIYYGVPDKFIKSKYFTRLYGGSIHA